MCGSKGINVSKLPLVLNPFKARQLVSLRSHLSSPPHVPPVPPFPAPPTSRPGGAGATGRFVGRTVAYSHGVLAKQVSPLPHWVGAPVRLLVSFRDS